MGRRREEWFEEDGSDQLETNDAGEEAMERNNWASQNSQRVVQLKEEENSASSWFVLYKYITMHSQQNIKFVNSTQQSFFRRLQAVNYSRNSPHSWYPPGSVPHFKILPHVPTLSHMNPVHTFPSCILKIHFNIILPSIRSLDSVVSIVTRLWAGQYEVQIPAGKRDSLLQNVQTSRAKPASYSVSTRGSCQGVKQPGHQANHSPPSMVKVKNEWSYAHVHSWCVKG